MRKKGFKPENWNWQVAERKEGFFPDEEEKENMGAFDLAHEMDQVEHEI